MKRFVFAVLILGLLWGCQKEAEQKPRGDAGTPLEKSTAEEAASGLEKARESVPVSPEPRFSEESKVWLTSGEGRPGEQVKLDLYYYLSEPAKTIVVPLAYLGNARIDSFSWVGSTVADYAMRPVVNRNELKVFHVAVVPMKEPDIPADSGMVGSIFFTIEKDAPPQTVSIETTFIYPGLTLSYVDTLISLVTPQWGAGSIKVIP